MDNIAIIALSNSIDDFFEKWIQTTPLSYRGKKLSSLIKKTKVYGKHEVIVDKLRWDSEPCGKQACRETYLQWSTMLFFKLMHYKKYLDVKIALDRISFVLHYYVTNITNLGISTNVVDMVIFTKKIADECIKRKS